MCDAMHVDVATVLRTVTGHSGQDAFRERFRAEVEASQRALDEAPVQLHGAGNLDLIYYLAEHVQAMRAIETGVSAGWSSLAFLLSLSSRDGAKLVSTDMPYPGSNKSAEAYVGTAVPAHLRTSWQRIDAPDREALPRALALLPEIDISHYDSDKSYEGRLWAYRLLWAATRPGGILISDDIDDNFAFFHFCGEVQRTPLVAKMAASKGHKFVGILVKP